MELSDVFAKIAKSEEKGCWLWTGFTNHGGYGRCRVGGKKMLTHRAAWESVHGPIPGSLCVLHRCDVPACINPDHLFLGTKAENNADKMKKHRESRGEPHAKIMRIVAARGEGSARSKLTLSQVAEIRRDRRNNSQVARAYGVSPQCVQSIRSGRTWKCAN